LLKLAKERLEKAKPLLDNVKLRMMIEKENPEKLSDEIKKRLS
jgi:4Fe-4S ferredoxin